VQVPPGQSLANRPVGNSTGQPGNGSLGLEETRAQAASLSLEMCIVVDIGIMASYSGAGKPTLSTRRKAAAPLPLGRGGGDTTGV
jgi:hypothetical protein